ncbi:MAG: hypothetical protein ACFFDI_27365 [Promethearchaeota archaeon]
MAEFIEVITRTTKKEEKEVSGWVRRQLKITYCWYENLLLAIFPTSKSAMPLKKVMHEA